MFSLELNLNLTKLELKFRPNFCIEKNTQYFGEYSNNESFSKMMFIHNSILETTYLQNHAPWYISYERWFYHQF